MRSVSIELVEEPGTTNAYRVLLRTSEPTPLILGTVIDHGGWAIGTSSYEPGEIDASKLEDVVSAILNYAWDVVSSRLVDEEERSQNEFLVWALREMVGRECRNVDSYIAHLRSLYEEEDR